MHHESTGFSHMVAFPSPAPPASPAVAPPPSTVAPDPVFAITSGRRNNTQFLAASRSSPIDRGSPIHRGSIGGLNSKLLSIAADSGSPAVSEERLLYILLSYNRTFCTPPLPDEEVVKIAHRATQYLNNTAVRTSGIDGALDMPQLMSQLAAQTQWAIPDLLPEGVTLLAGKPKMGKSWLALELALALASGELALGTLPTLSGHVFYLGLEDTQRRMQDRILKLMQGRAAPPNFSWAGCWNPLPTGGLDDLARWISGKYHPRLLVIDTLARLRSLGGSTPADNYSLIIPLKQLADQFHISILLIHHLRKSSAVFDPMDEISGSTFLTGATDCNMVLQRARGAMNARLHITGRDINEQQLLLSFDERTAAWSLAKEPDPKLPLSSQAILDLLLELGEPMSAPTIAQMLSLDVSNTRRMLSRMKEKGLVLQISRGMYVATCSSQGASNSEEKV